MINIKLRKIYVILAVAAFCLLLSTAALAAKGVVVKLVGQDDVNVDRPALQAAIDSAPGKKLTVKLEGTFQLDGSNVLINRSDLTIKGDEGGATLKGKLGPNGLPVDDFVNFPNRGFLIESSSPLRKIEIKDLALTGFRSAIFARGELNEIHDVSIKNNSMENSVFGVAVTGGVSNIKISDNDVNGVIETSVKAFSTSAGNVSDIKIEKNYFADAAWDAINIADIDGAIISDNFLSTTDENDFPIVFVALGANTNVVVEDNVLRGGPWG